jgi:hypothetical protein
MVKCENVLDPHADSRRRFLAFPAKIYLEGYRTSQKFIQGCKCIREYEIYSEESDALPSFM